MSITASGLYGLTLEKMLIDTAGQSLEAETHNGMLVLDAYTPNFDTHDFRNDVTNEITGTGYTAGGVTLAGVSVTYDSASNEARILWNDASWTSASFTARYAVIYKSRGGASSADEVVAYIDLDADQTVSSGTFTLDFTTAVLKITAS